MKDDGLAPLLLLILAVMLFRSCTQSQQDKFEDLLEDGPISGSTDFALNKMGSGKIAVIFAMVDDQELCEELATMLNKKYEGNFYYCTPAS